MLKIVSPRIGEVGTEFVPADGVNVEALIEGGFIVDDNTPPKPAKPVTTTEEI